MLLLFFMWHSLTFHIWKYALDPENSTSKHHHQQWAPSPPVFSQFFPYFHAIFHLAQPHFPYLEIHTGPWKQQPQTSSPTVSTIPPFFSCFFPYFNAIFHLAQPHFPYLEIHTGPWKQHPQTSSPTVSTIPPFFFLIFSLFSCYFSFGTASLSIFGNTHWTLKTAPPNIITNSEHHPLLFSLIFFLILMLFFIWHSLTFHIWKYAIDPENSTPKHHHQQWAPPPPLFFLPFFSYFIAIFHVVYLHFPYLEICNGPWQQYHYWNTRRHKWNEWMK